MLKSLHIENYRLFKTLDVPKLGRVNLITGKNNVGKTALLEAIRIYVNEGDRAILQNIVRKRGDWKNRIAEENLVSLFHQYDTDMNIRINDLYYKLGQSFVMQKRKESDIAQGNITINGGFFEGSIVNNYFFGEEEDRMLREKSISITADINQTNNFLWEDIVLTAKEEEVVKILQIIEPRILQIAIDSNEDNTKVRLKHARKPVPLKNFGDGMQRLLTIAISLVSAENSYLLIDEFDIGLYYDVQEELWDIIFRISKELNVQVFATTHSQDCIRAFTEVALKYEEHESQYFRLQRKRKGNDIIAIDYTSKDLEIAIEQQIETR